MKDTIECVCKNCSNLFLNEDEEMTLCPKCWKNYLGSQANK